MHCSRDVPCQPRAQPSTPPTRTVRLTMTHMQPMYESFEVVPPCETCDLCLQPRGLNARKRQELLDGKYGFMCLLCSYTDHCVCSNCFFEWKPIYADTGGIAREDYEDWMRPEAEDQHVCALCVVTKELGLDIESQMSPEEKSVCARVRRVIEQYGLPPISVISRTVITLPSRSVS